MDLFVPFLTSYIQTIDMFWKFKNHWFDVLREASCLMYISEGETP